MKQVRNQNGMTMTSMAMLATMIGFVAFFGFSLYEPFYSDMSVETIIENLPSDSKAKGASPKIVKGLIQKRLSVNRVDINKNDIVIAKTKEGVSVDINYEARVEFIANISLVASFSHSTVIPK